MKNKISTLSYFKKRLKDNGYVVWDIMNTYSMEDPRKWTVMLNPGVHSIYITCVINREEMGQSPEFEINDSGLRFQRNLVLRTSSIEVLVNMLTKRGILGDSKLFTKTEKNIKIHANDR